jgi:hypothetical protein
VNGVKTWIKMIATIMVKEKEDFMANKLFFFSRASEEFFRWVKWGAFANKLFFFSRASEEFFRWVKWGAFY